MKNLNLDQMQATQGGSYAWDCGWAVVTEDSYAYHENMYNTLMASANAMMIGLLQDFTASFEEHLANDCVMRIILESGDDDGGAIPVMI